MKNFKKSKYLYIAIAITIIFICIIVCFFIEHNDTNSQIIELDNKIEQDDKENNSPQAVTKKIVHIDGEVYNPGVYEIDEESRIVDVIEKAGGFTPEANISKVNLAYQVEDGQKIIIPNVHEKEQKTEEMQETSIVQSDDGGIIVNETKSNKKININAATQSELETLNGIGPSMASKIISYRKNNGMFKKIEDIKKVPGIGDSKYEGIKNDICI